ncbi:MAG: transferase hexapeptide repeat family protein [Saprospiraceae bacterium]|nr:transferase hexapeptide repeat family protein [Saprospiraceae bacterium]
MIYEFEGVRPVVHDSAFVHPQANVTGHVIIGKQVYIGPGAVLRGDWGEIVIEDGCNVQENCVIHMFPGVTVRLEQYAHIGHGAVIHGAHIEADCLIGMNSVLMDNSLIGAGSIVGALTFIKSKMHIPTRSLVVGNPGRIAGRVTDKMLDWKRRGTKLYQQLPATLHESLRPCKPLREIPTERLKPGITYQTWKDESEYLP